MNTTGMFFLCLSLFMICTIFYSIKKNRLSLDQSIWWVIGAVGIFIFGCWPDLIIIIAHWIGIQYAPSLLFLLGIAFLLLLGQKNSVSISELKEKNKELIQNAALLDERIRELEKVSRANGLAADHRETENDEENH
ncbi:MAG: DUF2304 domain-containing protein [Eubacteriaceae bacterium]|jgi:hypothetical protein